MRDTELFLARLWALDEELVAAGFLPLLDWWKREIARFYRADKRRWIVRKGRRVYASTSVAPRLAVAEMLFGEHRHIPGSPPVEYAFLSVKRDEAGKRLTGVTAILDALGVRYSGSGLTITLKDLPAQFNVITANHKTSVGGTLGFAWLDEVARWNDDEISKNPAEEVVGSLSPALATLPDAKLFLVSSPLTDEDYHAKQYDLGDTEAQHTSFGETWTINPTLSEDDTRKMEPDPRIWAREYAAIPSPTLTRNWFGIALDNCQASMNAMRELGTLDEPILPWVKYTVAIDPAFSRDKFGWAVVSSRGTPRAGVPRLTRVHETGVWPVRGRKPSELIEQLRTEVCTRYRVGEETSKVLTDQYEGNSFSELAQQSSVRLEVIPATGNGDASVFTRYSSVRIAMLQGALVLPDDPSLISEMKRVSSVFLPSGHEKIVLPRDGKKSKDGREGAGHLDRVSALVLACSEALKAAAQPELEAGPSHTDEGARLRAERIKEVEKRQREQWNRDPRVVMRGALRRA